MPSKRSHRHAAPAARALRRSAAPWFAAAAALGAVAVIAWLVLASAARPSGSATGEGAPALQLVAYQGAEALGGERVALASLIGQGKPVVLNFFAGLCPPCRAEMPGFQRAWERHQAELVVVGADIGPFLDLGSHEDARRLLAELGVSYPAAYVEENPVARFGIVGMPTTILYDGQGRLVPRHTGFLTEGQLEALIEAVLAKSP